MDEPGSASPEDRENRDERRDGLVRPYVNGDYTDSPKFPVGEEYGMGGWFWPDAQTPPQPTATTPVTAHRKPSATRRRSVLLGIAVATIAVASFVIAELPSSSPAVLASKCQPSSCNQDQAVLPAPDTAIPLAEPSSAGAYFTARPPASRHTTTATSTKSSGSTTTAAAPSAGATSPKSSPTSNPPPSLTPGSTISIRATTACCTTFYIRHDDGDNRVVITQITSGSSATAKDDATWIVRTGLAESSCISFESANEPGQYLRHFDFELYLEPNDGSHQFALDATFCPRPGNSGQYTSFQSVNYPNMYIRHFDYVVYLASDGGFSPWDTPTLWPYDSTWDVSRPWG